MSRIIELKYALKKSHIKTILTVNFSHNFSKKSKTDEDQLFELKPSN